MKAHGGCYDGMIRCAGCSNICSLFDALKISILHFLECTVTFLRLRFVESFFWHKCCDTKIATLFVNMKSNLLLFSGTGSAWH